MRWSNIGVLVLLFSLSGLSHAADTTCSVGEPIFEPLNIKLLKPYKVCVQDPATKTIQCAQGDSFSYDAEGINSSKQMAFCGLKSSEFNLRDHKMVGAVSLCANNTAVHQFIVNNIDCQERKSADHKYVVSICPMGANVYTVVFRASDKERKNGWVIHSVAGIPNIFGYNEINCGVDRPHFQIAPIPTQEQLRSRIDVDFKTTVIPDQDIDCTVGERSMESMNLRLAKPIDLCASLPEKDRKICKPISSLVYSDSVSLSNAADEACGFQSSELSLRDGEANGLLQLCRNHQNVGTMGAHYKCQTTQTRDHRYDLVICNSPGHSDTLTFAFADNMHTQGYLLATTGGNGRVLFSNHIRCGSDRGGAQTAGGYAF